MLINASLATRVVADSLITASQIIRQKLMQNILNHMKVMEMAEHFMNVKRKS